MNKTMDYTLHVKALLADYTQAAELLDKRNTEAANYKSEAAAKREAKILDLFKDNEESIRLYREYLAEYERTILDIEEELLSDEETLRQQLDDYKKTIRAALMDAPVDEYRTIAGDVFSAVAKVKKGTFDRELTLKKLRRMQEAYPPLGAEIQTLIDDCLSPDTREVAVTPRKGK